VGSDWFHEVAVDRARARRHPRERGLVSGDRQRRVLEAKAQSQGRTVAEVEAEAFSFTSIRRYVDPRQIADQIVYLASERGATVSGQAISVCGDTRMLA
jgi:NAD(P)-dependent dehydrogenase (short-subunit alcohol dehydrogenase family)